MVPASLLESAVPAVPAGSSAFAAVAAAVLAGTALVSGAVHAAASRRRLARRESRIANERRAIVALARAHAGTQPGFAADLYAAATRHGRD